VSFALIELGLVFSDVSYGLSGSFPNLFFGMTSSFPSYSFTTFGLKKPGQVSSWVQSKGTTAD
jgi:hypothetical protein